MWKARDIDGKFATSTDGKIFKPSSGEVVPEDEPLFLIRGRDKLAIGLLEHYAQMSVDDGCNDYHFEKLERVITDFKRFAQAHPDRMKQPSMTRGAPFDPKQAR